MDTGRASPGRGAGRGQERARGAPRAGGGKGARERGQVASQADGGGKGVLPRSRVSEIQRARMLHAMAEVAAQEGAQNASVARVVARSGVSRRTFYDLFEDREDCFLAAFEDALGRVSARALPAYGGAGVWQGRVRAALLAILVFFQEEPDLGRLLVVESLTAGPRAVGRRAQLVGVLVDAVREGEGEAKRGHGQPALSAEGVVGAVLSVVHARLQRGETDALTSLVNPLMGMIVLPYLGPAAARRESERPMPVLPPRPQQRRGDPLRDLDMRLTYRTVRVLVAIASTPGASNRQVAEAAGIADQGQISKLLLRLQNLGLIRNVGEGPTRGEPNAWRLTPKGNDVERTIHEQTTRTHEQTTRTPNPEQPQASGG
jgi:AcrR family transcriptional regulator/DNA-binding MarR family transcriptional regulator